MTRNQRVQLADLGERWIRAWARPDVSREDAAVMVTYWHLYEPADEELVAEVLGRFVPAEPPSVPGVDFLPPRRWRDRDGQFWSVGSDDLISLETERGPSRLFVLATVEELAELYGPLVEVLPDAEQVHELDKAWELAVGVWRSRCACGWESGRCVAVSEAEWEITQHARRRRQSAERAS